MLQVPAVTASVAASASGSEKNASSPSSARTPSSAKLRSCVVCRSRKVRCDKQSPCSNCRRANITCVFPSTDRPPRWARQLGDNAAASNAPPPQDTDPSIGEVMDRLRDLENLVKEMSGRQEQAHAAQERDVEKHQMHTFHATNTSSVQKQFGRLVLQDTNRSRYVSSGFWSRVNDEASWHVVLTPSYLHDSLTFAAARWAEDGYPRPNRRRGRKLRDEESPGKTFSTQELERTPSERHAFLFRHNLRPSTPDFREFHPLPSQIPFLLDMFSENVNCLIQIVHMPSVTKMVRDLRGSGMTGLTPANEALMFSICYAAITSMEGDDVMANFGSSKSDLNLKYRLGLEYALARADFLNAPDVVLVQALTIFLALVRRHDSPSFVWMMTGLVVRMAQYLGLQRDGANFEHLTPFDIEMRRRVWWCVCMVDMRASEDQGTDLTITSGSFDTKIPLNINDADIDPESKEMPTERDGITDMSFARISVRVYNIMRQMMAITGRDGAAGLEEQSSLLDKMYQEYERGYFRYTTELGNPAYWVTVTIARLVMAKMTLIVYLPVLFSSPSEHFSNEIRTKLLVSAIEVAEYNHALNAEQACRKWRWVYQTYTHWHAIVYLMIEISRHPWSLIVERAWVALHSSWLIPAQIPTNKNLRIWVPLRKLMAKARKHRHAELNRLRADPQAAARLEMEDQKIPLPSSSGPFPTGSSADIFRERWRQLMAIPPGGSGDGIGTSGISSPGLADSSMLMTYKSQPTARPISAHSPGDLSSNMTFGPPYFGTSGQQANQTSESNNMRGLEPLIATNAPSGLTLGQTVEPSYNPFPTAPTDLSDVRTIGLGFVPWLWADANPSVDVFSNLDMDSIDVDMDLDSEVNWYSWVESAKGME